ncbi:hypothetical protein [Gellertiella hungarica]|uniref:Chromosome segregation ATPase n=1 Tax=Gellertiella hungarica TaxID=1572859 RepID=A0A7W6NKR0_9HYPH|nr:hypothetical protein [Gellertiella hungarica]MBB4064794.1 chromosome segregation ATPase [Gellertiella hungarica]
MTSQWGRDGGGPPGRGGSAAGIIVTGVLALAVGLGAGYGVARFVSSEEPAQAPASPPAIPATRDGSLYKLYQETLRQREAAMRETGELRLKLVELQNHSGTLEAELRALKDASGAAPKPDAAAETLARSQRQRIEQLEGEMFDTRRVLDETRAALAKATRQREQAMKEAGDLKVRLTQLQSEASELETRNQDLALHARQAADKLTASEAEAAAATRERDRLKGELAAVKAERDALKAAQQQAPQGESEASDETDAPKPQVPDQSAAPRDRQAVADAIARAPGLKSLDFAERQKLADNLEKGACVTDALEDIFVRVPVLTLRSLIRDLDSPC